MDRADDRRSVVTKVLIVRVLPSLAADVLDAYQGLAKLTTSSGQQARRACRPRTVPREDQGVQQNRKLVAVFEISADANEDRRADAMWQAELAAKKAAVESGATVENLSIARHHHGCVVASQPDGQEFEARVATNSTLPGFTFPIHRQPTIE